MKKIIKIISLLCILILIFTFVACSANDNNQDNITDDKTYEEDNGSSVNQGSEESDTVENGYYAIGGFDPGTPFWCACSIKRSYNVAESYGFQLSFGTEAYVIENGGWENCDKVVVNVVSLKIGTSDDQKTYIFEELSAETFFTEKYMVKIESTYVDVEINGTTYQECRTDFIFSNTQTYQLSDELCEYDAGQLNFHIYAYAQDKRIGSGLSSVYYRKNEEKIDFMTTKEFYGSN